MSFFRFFRHHHHHHDHGHRGHHGHHGHHHHGFDEAAGVEHLTERVSARLDLNEAQQEKLVDMLECLWEQRAAIKSVDIAKDIGAMISGDRMDRAAAAAWVEQRVQAVQTAAPLVLTAGANFYDSLDDEQQQALRFMLRMRGAWARRFGGRSGGRSGERSGRGSAQ